MIADSVRARQKCRESQCTRWGKRIGGMYDMNVCTRLFFLYSVLWTTRVERYEDNNSKVKRESNKFKSTSLLVRNTFCLHTTFYRSDIPHFSFSYISSSPSLRFFFLPLLLFHFSPCACLCHHTHTTYSIPLRHITTSFLITLTRYPTSIPFLLRETKQWFAFFLV